MVAASFLATLLALAVAAQPVNNIVKQDELRANNMKTGKIQAS